MEADLFATQGMLTVSLVILGMELVSLIVMAAVVVNFLYIRAKHREFLSVLMPDSRTQGGVVLPLYIVSTILLTAATVFLFLWQPHLL